MSYNGMGGWASTAWANMSGEPAPNVVLPEVELGVPATSSSSTAEIKAWQVYLNTMGCHLATDGAWGPMTAAATAAIQSGKPCPAGATSGGTYKPATTPYTPATAYTPPGGIGAKKDTIMGLPKMAVYVGAGSLVLLGVAVVMTRKKKPAPKAMPAPVVAKATANI